jgi:hypothetical protein
VIIWLDNALEISDDSLMDPMNGRAHPAGFGWIVVLMVALGLCSCASPTATVATKTAETWQSVRAWLPGGDRVPVVDVREKDLKELPSGSELAKLQSRSRYGSFWMFGGPADFREPDLPPPGTLIEDGLLPLLDLR